MKDRRQNSTEKYPPNFVFPQVIETIRFSEAGPRDLVVSVKNNRVILGQKVYFKLDDGGQGHFFMNHAPSLSVENALTLIEALKKGVADIEIKAAKSGRGDDF